MDVLIRTDAVDRHQMMKEVAKPVALEQLNSRLRQEHLKATDSWYRTRVDVSDAVKNEKKFRKDFERVCPETLSPRVKDSMWRRAKQLKDEFIIGMLSKEELHPVKGFMKDGKMQWVVDESKMHDLNTINRESIWRKNNERKISEFKNIMRHLCPENPNAGDIEKFRPKTRDLR